MKIHQTVLDSYALLVFLFKQVGFEKVTHSLETANHSGIPALMASINWAEVQYMVERKAGPNKWQEVRYKLLSLPIEIISCDQTLAEQAGEIKAFHKMSLADCFCAALAKQKSGEIYTGDPEFRSIEDQVKIIWL